MCAAWDIIWINVQWIHCYGCGAHVLNLLAGDMQKIDIVSETLRKNKQVAVFFKSHSMAKEVLHDLTIQKFKKPLSTTQGCPTRWSSEFFLRCIII